MRWVGNNNNKQQQHHTHHESSSSNNNNRGSSISLSLSLSMHHQVDCDRHCPMFEFLRVATCNDGKVWVECVLVSVTSQRTHKASWRNWESARERERGTQDCAASLSQAPPRSLWVSLSLSLFAWLTLSLAVCVVVVVAVYSISCSVLLWRRLPPLVLPGSIDHSTTTHQELYFLLDPLFDLCELFTLFPSCPR